MRVWYDNERNRVGIKLFGTFYFYSYAQHKVLYTSEYNPDRLTEFSHKYYPFFGSLLNAVSQRFGVGYVDNYKRREAEYARAQQEESLWEDIRGQAVPRMPEEWTRPYRQPSDDLRRRHRVLQQESAPPERRAIYTPTTSYNTTRDPRGIPNEISWRVYDEETSNHIQEEISRRSISISPFDFEED